MRGRRVDSDAVDPNESPEPPPLSDQAPVRHTDVVKKSAVGIGALLLILFSKGKAILAFIVPALKFLKLGKIATTMGTMFVSVWFYSLAFGWWFALGFVVLILIHEMGHVYVAWKQGIPVSAPIFIPGMGALILQKKEGKSAWNEAVMGIGGPIAGALGGVVCWMIYSATGSELFLGLAYVTFMINLFNLMPVYPLDGGWITGAVSPYLWLIGFVGLVAMFVSGFLRNPMILILLVMSLPRLWQGIRHGIAHGPGVEPATFNQKIQMGLAYVSLVGALAWAMAETNVEWTPDRQRQHIGTAA